MSYDTQYGNQYESFVDTAALSDDTKVVYIAERYTKKGIIINATTGEMIMFVQLKDSSYHQIKSAIVNYNSTRSDGVKNYLAYVVSQNSSSYSIYCLELNITNSTYKWLMKTTPIW